MSVIRTFVAVDVSPAIRAAAARQVAALQAIGVDGYTWVDTDQLHLTLKFLGNIQDTEAPEVCSRVQKAVRSRSPVVLTVQGLGAFPGLDHPRTLWMGITEGVDEIRALQKEIDLALQPMGFPPERNEFSPHITLGRLARGTGGSRLVGEYMSTQLEKRFGTVEVDEVVVYSSFAERKGRSHTPMATVGLEG